MFAMVGTGVVVTVLMLHLMQADSYCRILHVRNSHSKHLLHEILLKLWMFEIGVRPDTLLHCASVQSSAFLPVAAIVKLTET